MKDDPLFECPAHQRELDARSSDLRAELTWKRRAQRLAASLGEDPERMTAEDWEALLAQRLAEMEQEGGM